MRAARVRELAVVVAVATVGVLAAAFMAFGPLTPGDPPQYPRIVELHPPAEPQP